MKTTKAASHRTRSDVPEDLEFLWDMLYEAIHWPPENPEPKPPREIVLSEPGISHYLEGWGRKGDAAVIALDGETGGRIGAAWYRLMPPDDPGYGFVDAETPEVGVAVRPEHRGRGVGGALLDALADAARSQGFGALSLSVQNDNPTAMKLYERKGFVKLFEAGGAWTMKLELPSKGAPEHRLTLTTLDERLAVCRLAPDSELPAWATTSAKLFSVTRTAEELSVVCPEAAVPEGVECEKNWRVFELAGPFEFSMVGVLVSVAGPLAEAGVGIFAVSTFDTDYVLVKEEKLDRAITALRERGHEVT